MIPNDDSAVEIFNETVEACISEIKKLDARLRELEEVWSSSLLLSWSEFHNPTLSFCLAGNCQAQ